jgi:hypothetical protein
VSNAINLDKFKAKKKKVADSTNFQRNYNKLNGWEKETWQIYRDACEAMVKLFAQVGEEWRKPNDHLPEIVLFSIDRIIKNLNK